MTEQEAEAWTKKLTRIWEPETQFLRKDPVAGRNSGSLVWLWANVHRILKLEVAITQSSALPHIALFGRAEDMQIVTDHEFVRLMQASPSAFHYLFAYSDCKNYIETTAVWRPFFRRGCWLSGLPIEATAHEKAEWILGFSREELEAWNLKM